MVETGIWSESIGCTIALDIRSQKENLMGRKVRRSVVRLLAASFGLCMTATVVITPTAHAATVTMDITTISGTGTAGYSGNGRPAISAALSSPNSITSDAKGNIIFSDNGNSVVRVIAAQNGTFFGTAMTAGDIYTVAGDGTSGYLGSGGPATSAELNSPKGVAVDPEGNLIIGQNNVVSAVAAVTGNFYGIAMTAGDIYTIAGNGTNGVSSSGVLATSSPLEAPVGVAVDAHGNVVFSDYNNEKIQVVAGSTGTFYGIAMTEGYLYTIAGTGSLGYSGDGGPALSAALSNPIDVTVDSAGNVIISDVGNNRVRAVAASTGTYYGIAMTAGDIYTIAGNGTAGATGIGGLGTAAELNNPVGVSMDASGNVIIADPASAVVDVLAGSTGTYYGVSMTVGYLYALAGNGTNAESGDGGTATAASLNQPSSAVAGGGRIDITDYAGNVIRAVYPTDAVQASSTITAGTLSFVLQPGSVTFTPITLSGVDQTSTASELLDIGDNTGSGSGWNVTLSNTVFTASSGATLQNSDFTVPLPAAPGCDTGSSCAPAVWTSGFVPLGGTGLPGATATKLLSAASSSTAGVPSGMGNQTVTLLWSAVLPSSSLAGNYSSTWTITLAAGP